MKTMYMEIKIQSVIVIVVMMMMILQVTLLVRVQSAS